MSREQPAQQAPPVQRLRLRYAKRGRLRFASHRDFSRAFERALMRARIPMAYSSGFNPHPRISYAGAAPTGAASEAEYAEIGLREVSDPGQVLALLDEALPPGLDVLEVVESAGGALADRLEASHWLITLPEVSVESAALAVAEFLAADEVLVERMTKRGLREFDARAAVVRLEVPSGGAAVAGGASGGRVARRRREMGVGPSTDDNVARRGRGVAQQETADQQELFVTEDTERPTTCAILDLVLRHGTPAVRPDDILVGLHHRGGLPSSTAALIQRLAQGPLDSETGTVGDPLAPDRDAK
ncbi:MAG: TIGR03936 family radical SAM-associated protein [Nocardioidaceae bacterium]